MLDAEVEMLDPKATVFDMLGHKREPPFKYLLDARPQGADLQADHTSCELFAAFMLADTKFNALDPKKEPSLTPLDANLTQLDPHLDAGQERGGG